jgi:predicted dehydrogenase
MTYVSRRSFLGTSSLSVLAAGSMLPFAIGADKPKANETLGIAIVGAGGRAHVHGDAFAKDKRVKVLYFCDPDINRANSACQSFAKKHGYTPKALQDFRPVLEDKNVDAVSCASSNHWHALCTVWAMQAGKHCYMEKPITHNFFENKAVAAAVKKYGLVYQAGTQCRSTENVNAAVKFIREGKIGEVKFVRSLTYRRRNAIGAIGEYPVPQGVDYDFWLGPAEVKPLTRKNFHYDWHWQRAYGNGDAGNMGAHQLDVARWFLGVEQYPQTVSTYGGRIGYDIETKNPDYRDAGDVANTLVSVFDYGDKCLVSEIRALATPPFAVPVESKLTTDMGVVAYGTEGYVVLAPNVRHNDFEHSAAYDLKGNLLKDFKDAVSKQYDDVYLTGRHTANFVDAILADKPESANADVRTGTLSAVLTHLANLSYYFGESHKISAEELKRKVSSVKSLDDNEATLARTLEHIQAAGVDLKKTPLSWGEPLKIDVEKETILGKNITDDFITRHYRKGFAVPAENL